jgi:RND superfamily putative drug exporter
MFGYLGRLAVARPWRVCAAWLVLATGLTLLAPSWGNQTQDDDIRFLPPDAACARGYRLMERAFPRDVCASNALFALERLDRPLSPADLALADRLAADLRDLQHGEPALQITGVCSHRDGPVGARLTSADGHCTLLQVSLATPYLAVQTREAVDRTEAVLKHRLAEAADPPLLHTTGPAGIGRDLVAASAESLDRTTLATVLLVVVVLLAIYRAPLMALIPLATIGVAVWVSLELLDLVTLIPGVHLANVSQVFAVVILFGAGTDYCLFLISRYREELEAGQTAPVSLTRGVRAVGGALAASAGTVICGLGMMGFAEFGKIRAAGPVIALGLGVALFASLSLTPALLRLIGRAAFWPGRVTPSLPGRQRGGGWAAVSAFVVRRPLLVWCLALAVLVPPAVLGLFVQPTFRPVGDLGPSAASVRGLGVIQQRFTAGQTGPVTVLLAAPCDWTGWEGRELIDHLSRGFAGLDNVAEVRSLTRPLGQPLPELDAVVPGCGGPKWLGSLQRGVDGLVRQVHRQAADFYVGRSDDDGGVPLQVTRLDVVLKSDPFDPASVATLEQIELWLRKYLPERPSLVGPVRAECYGVTVHTRDLAAVVARDRGRVNGLVLGGVLVILLVLVRRPWLAAYLLATVLLSYYATLGMTAVFASWLSARPFGQVEWRVPFFLFTILVAVGEDYNILLVTRVLQERKRLGVREGVRRGLARTGGTITSCGVIMAGTFGTLMLNRMDTLVQIGFALAFGVLLDTFVVRPFLVPAFLLMVWKDEARPQEEFRPLRLRARPELRRAG